MAASRGGPPLRAALAVVLNDGGDTFGAYAVQVQVDLLRPFDRWPWFLEGLGGLRRFVDLGHAF